MNFLNIKNNFYLYILTLIFGFLSFYFGYFFILFLFSLLVLFFIFEKFETAFYVLIFYLPFQLALNVAQGFDVASGRVLILIFFIVWFFKSLKDKKIIINFSLQTILVLIFLFLASFSILQSFELERAVRKILVFFTIFPLYFVFTSFENNLPFLKKISKIIIASAFILSVLGLFQFISQFIFGIDPVMNFLGKYIAPVFYGRTFGAEVVSNPSWLVNVAGITLMRSFSLFPDPHVFSFYLGMIIPIIFSFIYFKNNKKEEVLFNNNVLRFFLIVLVFAELFTFSRGGYLGMTFSFLFIIILLWKRLSNFNKKFWILVPAFFLTVSVFLNSSVFKRFFSIFDLKEGSNTERISNWLQGVEIFSNNFIKGVGIGNYSYVLDPTLPYRAPVYAHNLYLDIGAEMGVITLLAWVLLILVTLWQLFRLQKKSDDFISFLAIGLMGSLVWFSVHAFFDTPIYSPQILSMFLIIISLSALVISYNKTRLNN